MGCSRNTEIIKERDGTSESVLFGGKMFRVKSYFRPTKTSLRMERGGDLVLGGKDMQNCDAAYSP